MLTAWMDAAVVDENDPVATDPHLDLVQQGPRTALLPEFLVDIAPLR
ncbi:hypothetical protein I545_6914 [Mycobacterium kansasii 662]|uniref:Uncharacterized protein n=1 Tax=Mycobacterium kansasii 662 TaxID=1299326 RepID=X7XQU4_MYCKA|nr:hypothetical protein I545_6914 [Mycobacterium kansasii 662]